MDRSLSVTEVVRNFAEYINRVVYRRERFLLHRGRRPVAELRPVPAGRTLGELAGLLAGAPRLEPGDADRFLEELRQARDTVEVLGRGDPWES